MKVTITKAKNGAAVAKDAQGNIINSFRADWAGGTFAQAADELAKHLLAKHDNISISMGDMPMFEQVAGKLVWSALDAGLSA